MERKQGNCSHMNMPSPVLREQFIQPFEISWKSCRGAALRVEIEIAESGHLRPLAAWRPLAATRLELAGAATCGHLRPLEWLRVAATGCEWLRAGRNTWQSWHLEKISFAGKAFFFKFGGWIGRILSCLAKPCGKPYTTHVFHSAGKILGRSINGGGGVEN